MLNYYLHLLGNDKIPSFLQKYLVSVSLLRLQNVGYFCGMDYASKDVYDFKEKISRYDHSLSTALLTWLLTKNEEITVSALIHDVSTPCFSHVIDYMNKDYIHQESTEEYTKEILNNDKFFKNCLSIDNLDFNKVINFKNYSVVDLDRPMLCADRLDGIILTSIGWTKNIKESEIKSILNHIKLYKNEEGKDEIGFDDLEVAKLVMSLNNKINEFCHSKEDNYMMELLASITRYSINKKYISYNDLYFKNEHFIYYYLKRIKDNKLKEMIHIFETIKRKEISNIELETKNKELNVLVLGKRCNN